MGTSRRIKAENPAVQAVAVQPGSPLHGIESTKHMASTIRSSILNESLIDEVVTVTTARAYGVTRALGPAARGVNRPAPPDRREWHGPGGSRRGSR